MNYNPVRSRILISIQRPSLWVLSFLLLLCVVAAMGWLSFKYGQHEAGYDKSGADEYIEALQLQMEDLKVENTESQRQTAMLERNSTIDGGASEQLKISLNEAQTEAVELKKELSFYKSIITPGDTKRSLMIQTIQLKKNANGTYQYKIMVSQRGQNDRFARGKIDVLVGGSDTGVAKVLKLSEVSAEVKKSISFGFKYFQNFSGAMTLPATFQPEFMRVKVKPKSRKIDPIDEQFAWADLTAVGE